MIYGICISHIITYINIFHEKKIKWIIYYIIYFIICLVKYKISDRIIYLITIQTWDKSYLILYYILLMTIFDWPKILWDIIREIILYFILYLDSDVSYFMFNKIWDRTSGEIYYQFFFLIPFKWNMLIPW